MNAALPCSFSLSGLVRWLCGLFTKIHGPTASPVVFEGGKRERKSGMGSSGPRAFRGRDRGVDGLLVSFLFAAAVAAPFFDAGNDDASCSCWMVVRRCGWTSDQYGSGS